MENTMQTNRHSSLENPKHATAKVVTGRVCVYVVSTSYNIRSMLIPLRGSLKRLGYEIYLKYSEVECTPCVLFRVFAVFVCAGEHAYAFAEGGMDFKVR